MSDTHFQPLYDGELHSLQQRIDALRAWYGQFDFPPLNQCEFHGSIDDIGALDYIFYELGAHSWDWDSGLTHAAAWGNVATNSFGFEWCKVPNETSPHGFAVRHPDVPCLIFPWHRLFELEHNPGRSDGPHSHLLLSTIHDVDNCSVAPDGWHPVLDAIQGRRHDIPKDVVSLLETLCDRDPYWIHHLDLYPYDWGEQTDWNQVLSAVNSWIKWW